MKTRAGLNPTPIPLEIAAAGEELHLDLVGPLPTTARGNTYILTVKDSATKFVVVVPIIDKSAATVARALVERVYLRLGAPDRIITDQGGEFCNRLNEAVNNTLGIAHRTTSPYHPAANGVVERMHADLEMCLRCITEPDQSRWDLDLPYVEFALNTTWTRTTGETPFFLWTGRQPRTLVDLVVRTPFTRDDQDVWLTKLLLARRVAAAQSGFARGITPPELRVEAEEEVIDAVKVGDLVMIKFTGGKDGKATKLLARQQGPYRVIAVRDGVTAKLQHVQREKDIVERHAKYLVPVDEQMLDEAGDDEFEVEGIQDEAVVEGETKFLVKWKGFPEDRNTWATEEQLVNAPEILEAWRAKQSQKDQEAVVVDRVVDQRIHGGVEEFLVADHAEDGPDQYVWLKRRAIRGVGIDGRGAERSRCDGRRLGACWTKRKYPQTGVVAPQVQEQEFIRESTFP
jgi:hypothetical protein